MRVVILIITVFLLVPYLAVLLDSHTCTAKWGDFDHKYSFFGGCQIKQGDRWIPAENLRDITLNPA